MPRKSLAGTEDLEPSKIGRKRIQAQPKKELPKAKETDENKNNNIKTRGASGSRSSGDKANNSAEARKQKKV